MKKTLTILFLNFCTVLFAQQNVIEKSNELIQSKKYQSAFEVLNNADKNNQNPEIVLAKTDLLLNYFANSLMHQIFSLRDLEEHESIEQIRGSEGVFSMYVFHVDSILSDLIVRYPKNYEIRKQLGEFYHEVYFKYQGQWLLSDDELVEKFKQNYLEAYNNGVYDYWSLYGIAYAHIYNNDFNGSIEYFEKSIELNKQYPSSHYNLAYVYLNTGQNEKAIKSALLALELYDEIELKADAARLVAIAYRDSENLQSAMEYYNLSDQIAPENYYTLVALLQIELKLNHKDYPNTTQSFFDLAPENPTIYSDLMDMYFENEKEAELLGFFTKMHSKYAGDDLVNANLYFYGGAIEFKNGNSINAKENFTKARQLFEKIFESEHQVFEVIDSYLVEINQR